MGNYPYDEFVELFGNPPEPGDRNYAHDWRGAADLERDRVKDGYYDEPVLPADHPGFKECGTCGAHPRADLERCPLCGRSTS